MRRVSALVVAALAIVLAGATGGAGAPPAKLRLLFDDFTYTGRQQLQAHGWIVRTAPGWPGVAGAKWSADDVSLVDDPAFRGNRLLRLSSSTNGTAQGTTQTQVCHQRKYREGTYATRVRFRDQPRSGPGGDHLVETFYTISPLRKPLDPSYSELDFEYLPNGGWGYAAPTLWVTSWETFSPEPDWSADNTSTYRIGSKDGWHVLVLQVAHGAVTYFIDGVPLAVHGARFYPEVPMSIDYNLWFIRDGLQTSREPRGYDEDVDWVFHEAGAVLWPRQVAVTVAQLRRARVGFRDTVPAARPPLASPCNF